MLRIFLLCVTSLTVYFIILLAKINNTMSYLQLAYLHLGTIFPAFLIGLLMLMTQKGTARHRLFGKIYMLLMLTTAVITLFMTAQVGARLFGHFGFIHLFSLFVLYSIPAAYFAIRQGKVKQHQYHMLGVYIGGILIAGAFTFMPGRLLHTWFIA